MSLDIPLVRGLSDHTAYSRLVQGIRDSESGSSSGMLGRAWNFNVEAQEAEFRDDLRAASGVGKRKGKVRQYTHRSIPKSHYWLSVGGGKVLC